MKYVCLLFCSALLVTLIGCSNEAGPPESPVGGEPVDNSVVEASQDTEAYPIDYCIVSGEKLGTMGDAVEVTVNDRTVKLCCTMCETKLRKDPEKYLTALDAAAADDTGDSTTGDVHDDHDHE